MWGRETARPRHAREGGVIAVCDACQQEIEDDEDYIEADWDGAKFHARDECLAIPFVLEQWLNPDHPYVAGFTFHRVKEDAAPPSGIPGSPVTPSRRHTDRSQPGTG